jgi:hypothetical protein
MKKLLYLALLSCSSIFALPEWQFTVDAHIDGETYRTIEQIPYKMSGESQSVCSYLEPHFFATVTCSELNNDEVIYVVDVLQDTPSESNEPNRELIVRGTVTARVGEDASITLHSSQGEFTITFSSKI